MQPKLKQSLYNSWMAETKKEAKKAFDNALECYGAKYPKAMECLNKDREELLAFYDFPAEHLKQRIALIELAVSSNENNALNAKAVADLNQLKRDMNWILYQMN
jgi:transposase-like protein